MKKKIKVILFEGHHIARKYYTEILEEQGIEVSGQAKNENEMFTLLKKRKPDVVIYGSLITACQDFRKTMEEILKISKDTKVLVSEDESSEFFIEFCIEKGARGYYDKGTMKYDLLVDVVKLINKGDTIIVAA